VVPSAASPDIDRILEAIRAEARARGSKGRVGPYATDDGLAGLVRVASHGLPAPEATHVADFLALPLDVFLAQAYQLVLGRPADPAGTAHYQRALLRGKLTRIEVLGRLRLSPEGRAYGSAVRGVMPAFLLATGYRIPLVGPLAALAARALGLPSHWQDRTRLEATALAAGGWMKR
jgi:hypothetical protein